MVGIPCWDLNGNLNCDAGEDKNNDGECDASDCQTTSGQAGTACWDLNENGSCDLADEDWNGDELCDVLDCQGPPAIGHLVVRDGNGLFLGYLLDYEGEGPGIGKLEVYNPDIPGYFILSCASQDSKLTLHTSQIWCSISRLCIQRLYWRSGVHRHRLRSACHLQEWICKQVFHRGYNITPDFEQSIKIPSGAANWTMSPGFPFRKFALSR